MSMETELKFQVSAARSAALHKAVGTATARSTRLQAVYFDTPDRQLAAAGVALRLRKEGRVWVQTLKGRGDGLARRLEHEVRLGAQAAVPALDIARHAGTPAAAALSAALGAAQAGGAELQPIYRADIRRLHRIVRVGGAAIEIAHDQGEIIAGERRLKVDEIEFELISGPASALPALAARWVSRFGLWWDVRTKSEQGHRLALGLDGVPAVKSVAPALAACVDTRQAWQAMVQATLAQAMPNAAEIAGGSGTPEHLHQLRVALRRLRSVLRVYADWGGDAAAALALEADWRAPFADLGAARDRDVMAATLRDALTGAAAPPFDWPAGPPAPAAGEVVRSAAVTLLLLRTLALAEGAAAPQSPPTTSTPDGKALAKAARDRLLPLWRRVRRDARAFASRSVAEQHRLRKRLKRLRYALEPFWGLLKKRPAARLRRALLDALDALGELNDLHQAEALFRTQAAVEPAAWFAVGYVSARREAAERRAGRRLAALAAVPVVWRRRSVSA